MKKVIKAFMELVWHIGVVVLVTVYGLMIAFVVFLYHLFPF
tara:strand:- start:1055 stop:1177 length:123 start_codon:yes stop_codon:yes gene_type:complete